MRFNCVYVVATAALLTGCQDSPAEPKPEPVPKIENNPLDDPKKPVRSGPKSEGEISPDVQQHKDSRIVYSNMVEHNVREFRRYNKRETFRKEVCDFKTLKEESGVSLGSVVAEGPYSPGNFVLEGDREVLIVTDSDLESLHYRKARMVKDTWSDVKMLLTNKAFLEVYGGQFGVPKIVPTTGFTPSCEARSLVMDISQTGRSISGNMKPKGLFKLAAQLLAQIQKFHSIGIALGLIDLKMIGRDAAGDYHLRTFHFAGSYLDDRSGKHVADGSGDYEDVSPDAMRDFSPWVLDTMVRTSRRDDIFQLAFLVVLEYPGVFNEARQGYQDLESNAQVANWKRKLLGMLKPGTLPAEVSEFYQYALGLKFDETPDYQKWINTFTALVK